MLVAAVAATAAWLAVAQPALAYTAADASLTDGAAVAVIATDRVELAQAFGRRGVNFGRPFSFLRRPGAARPAVRRPTVRYPSAERPNGRRNSRYYPSSNYPSAPRRF